MGSEKSLSILLLSLPGQIFQSASIGELPGNLRAKWVAGTESASSPENSE
jgi:hypothetical protein